MRLIAYVVHANTFEICFVVSSEHSCDKVELPSWLEQRLMTEWAKQQVILKNEDLQRKYRRVKFTGPFFCLSA